MKPTPNTFKYRDCYITNLTVQNVTFLHCGKKYDLLYGAEFVKLKSSLRIVLKKKQ
jgi:hypothetical protein